MYFVQRTNNNRSLSANLVAMWQQRKSKQQQKYRDILFRPC